MVLLKLNNQNPKDCETNGYVSDSKNWLAYFQEIRNEIKLL